MTNLLSIIETAEVLSVSKETVYRMIGRGDLPYCKVGSRKTVPLSGIEGYIQDNTTWNKPCPTVKKSLNTGQSESLKTGGRLDDHLARLTSKKRKP